MTFHGLLWLMIGTFTMLTVISVKTRSAALAVICLGIALILFSITPQGEAVGTWIGNFGDDTAAQHAAGGAR